MDVHLGKFLIMSCLFNCLDAALTITVRSFAPLNDRLGLRVPGEPCRPLSTPKARGSHLSDGKVKPTQ